MLRPRRQNGRCGRGNDIDFRKIHDNVVSADPVRRDRGADRAFVHVVVDADQVLAVSDGHARVRSTVRVKPNIPFVELVFAFPVNIKDRTFLSEQDRPHRFRMRQAEVRVDIFVRPKRERVPVDAVRDDVRDRLCARSRVERLKDDVVQSVGNMMGIERDKAVGRRGVGINIKRLNVVVVVMDHADDRAVAEIVIELARDGILEFAFVDPVSLFGDDAAGAVGQPSLAV